MSEQHSSLHIIIVGAGLGGLSAAVSSAPAGHKITVLESAPQLTEVRPSSINGVRSE